MISFDISVILCTHNARPDFLSRTLAALRNQTLARSAWELILVDNASTPPVGASTNLDWHPAGQIILEPALGLTKARLCGIARSSGALLIFVDDDNVLAPDYLEQAAILAKCHPHLGAWSGNSLPEYEKEPEQDLAPLLARLALRRVEKPVWSNFSFDTMPFGAGLCILRTVAETYVREIGSHPYRRRLDRTGKSLSSCGDTDLAMTAWDMGLSTGVFPELTLTHLMPAGRVCPDYLRKINEGAHYSHRMLLYFRTGIVPPSLFYRGFSRLIQWMAWRLVRPRGRRIELLAIESAFLAADRDIKALEQQRRRT